jgi:hypothetical protein
MRGSKYRVNKNFIPSKVWKMNEILSTIMFEYMVGFAQKCYYGVKSRIKLHSIEAFPMNEVFKTGL